MGLNEDLFILKQLMKYNPGDILHTLIHSLSVLAYILMFFKQHVRNEA